MISAGEVCVNGRVVTELGSRARPGRDHVKVRGRLLGQARFREYCLLNKPVGCVSTMKDPQGRLCVGDIASGLGVAVYPVGRLDYNSSGLLLLTNDGELAERLMHPRYEIEKVYKVKVDRTPGSAELRRLRQGLKLADGKTKPAYVAPYKKSGNKAWVEFRISEGRNRQVRRMCEAVGLNVEKLRRTALGPLRLGRLAGGGLRRLGTEEIAELRHAVGLD